MGDIHGQRRALEELLDRIGEDAVHARAAGLTTEIVFLGDYIDRGDESCPVLERLCGTVLDGVSCRFLMGNHEAVLLDFLNQPAAAADWLDYGGVETLASYGVRASLGIRERARCEAVRDRFLENLPDHHRGFLDSLETMVVAGDYVFVHAGIRPGRRLDRQRASDLLWIREPFLSDRRPHEKVVVHGHTMVAEPEMRGNRIGIDTGAYATGVLTALVLEEDRQCLIQARA
ncbi:metallophosphoesterase family protein [Azospirillum sp.]|uniref:metallophosphoesterase family protein n=1 Tax=Azospirillum sp. TaxID=34012 RepID=UPI003D7133CF